MTTIAPPIGSRWRHIKRGTYYTVINHGTMQLAVGTDALGSAIEMDDAHVTIYEAESDHSVWVRPTAEFLDGRFRQIALP